tara:strand:- start:1622 stop:2461 length:840 start_codon:yes stop_codon:yes gene_type:complete
MIHTFQAPISLAIANIFFTGSFSLVKYLSNAVPIETIMLFRFMAGPIFLIPFFLVKKKKLIIKSYPLFFLRVFFGISAMSCLFLSFKYGSIGKSMLIFECSTIWTLLIGYYVYNNKPHPYSLWSIPFAFVGLFLILKPTGLLLFNLGDIFALIGSFFNTGVYITLKKLRNHHDSITIVLVAYFLSSIILIIPNSLNFPMIIPSHLYLLCIMCSIGLIGQMLMTYGFKFSSAGICSLLMLINVPLTTISGIVFFNESYTLSAIFGIILVFCSLITIARWQ